MKSKFRSLLSITIITLVAGLYSLDNAAFAAGNFGVGGHTFGTSAEGTLGITNGTEPTTAPADVVQLYSKDKANGDNRLHIKTESGDTISIGNSEIEASSDNLSLQPSSGNVGIGAISPGQKLVVSGKIQVGNDSATPTAGTIRFTGTDFEGYTGTEWVSLTGASANPEDPNYTACLNAGGSWVDAQSVCYFPGSSCASGWTKEANYSSTSNMPCSGTSLDSRCSSGCSTGAHVRINASLEGCNYYQSSTFTERNGGRCSYSGSSSCTATQTEVGCTISSS